MKLGFYYHITIDNRADGIWTPSYQGVFIDSLASNVETLYLIMHQSNTSQVKEADYKIKAQNIIIINLGLKTPAWHRDIFYKKILKEKFRKIQHIDHLLVRAPTPLGPYFKKYLGSVKMSFLIVGDYAESVEQTKPKTFREWVINRYLIYNDWRLRLAMKTTDVIVNSPALLKKYVGKTKTINLIKTTTLSQSDFFVREQSLFENEIKILYTGRIDPLKGLFELVEVLAKLRNANINAILYIVGWETNEQKIVENRLIELAKKLNVNNYLIFPGRKSVGPELNAMYRMADIYCLPSYEEGFPKTIWEALANSLPVISTLVGGIPDYLANGIDSLLVKPKNIDELYQAFLKVIRDPDLRQKLMENGLKKAKEVTLENQAKKLMNILEINSNN